MSWKQNQPASCSKNPKPSSELKPKEQPTPKVYVDMRDKNFAENKRIKDGLPPVNKHTTKPPFEKKQNSGPTKDAKNKK
jgi:hypothetical protein